MSCASSLVAQIIVTDPREYFEVDIISMTAFKSGFSQWGNMDKYSRGVCRFIYTGKLVELWGRGSQGQSLLLESGRTNSALYLVAPSANHETNAECRIVCFRLADCILVIAACPGAVDCRLPLPSKVYAYYEGTSCDLDIAEVQSMSSSYYLRGRKRHDEECVKNDERAYSVYVKRRLGQLQQQNVTSTLFSGVVEIEHVRSDVDSIPQVLENTSGSFFLNMNKLLKDAEDLFFEGLKDIPLLTCPRKPEGSMFAMLNLSAFNDVVDDTYFCMKLAKEESMVLFPAFKKGGVSEEKAERCADCNGREHNATKR
ncbi:tyrosine/nicotianamine aminotransferase, Pyridoxal phosphate-dependent transferase [Artemisia annua]|uniref:Tyrosine/nicotianamine aminotransferase, Pyridoxal phosphate-dependent transferase n=1 Tax=Artemisia annua TaxID=35608 RepID=A0A2U1PYN5_ARTAN|nr:tyrosine/nicotianamine aminotransferase, Pyridoxal phosphate-dependent transferase [Artemisia annua]